jgi:rhamnulokinase
MGNHIYVALDLGAESGRSILGTLCEGRLTIEELFRFPNEMKQSAGHLRWNVDGLFGNIKQGLRVAARSSNRPESIAIDTWGVDFGFLKGDGALLEPPCSYRDHRTDGMMEKFFDRVPRPRIYELTGIQFMQLNSLFQLYASVLEYPDLYSRATHVLFMPDLFNYLLTGIPRSEFTIATTSQLFNPRLWTGIRNFSRRLEHRER